MKTEANSRSYFIKDKMFDQFRRTDIDVGLSYTRLLSYWVGFELFSGYRYNISNELPQGVSMDKGGAHLSAEFFVVPSFKKK